MADVLSQFLYPGTIMSCQTFRSAIRHLPSAIRHLPSAIFFVSAPLAAQTAKAAPEVKYEVSFPNAAHHEARVSMIVSGLPRGTASLRMSRSSPGRYALHEFAKNVYGVEMTDGQSRPLTFTRPDPYQWDVAGHDGTIRVTYTLFADRGDGTYAQIDRTHAHLNIPAVFMWARGLDARPIRVKFTLPDGVDWTAATQLFPAQEPLTFTAPNLQYFMDSPIDLGSHMVREWTARDSGKSYPIRLALHHLGTAEQADSFAAKAQRVVAQQVAMWGELPKYDVGYYTFIADYLPWASGDGMEHRNSTIVSSTGNLKSNEMGLLGTVSHEYFHSWNVERLRPKSLEPFNFERANMSGELWFAEGFTNYYGPLFIHRAGLNSIDDFARAMGNPINNVINSPARKFFSPVEMSMQAPFVDAATAIDPTNFDNTFISYYTWGSVVGIGLDLTLRTRFGKPLDGFMRSMWQKHGRTEVPYTINDLEAQLGVYTGDKAFAKEFFDRYIRGRDVVDFAALLPAAGMVLRPRAPDAAYLGQVFLTYDSAGATISSSTIMGSPLYLAGLDRGDRILTLDGKALVSDSVFQAIRGAHQPGDEIRAEVESRGTRKDIAITLVNDPRLEIVTFEKAGRTVTPEIEAFRKDWLGPK
jgi:predicted metalloprotease with PDZ domain